MSSSSSSSESEHSKEHKTKEVKAEIKVEATSSEENKAVVTIEAKNDVSLDISTKDPEKKKKKKKKAEEAETHEEPKEETEKKEKKAKKSKSKEAVVEEKPDEAPKKEKKEKKVKKSTSVEQTAPVHEDEKPKDKKSKKEKKEKTEEKPKEDKHKEEKPKDKKEKKDEGKQEKLKKVDSKTEAPVASPSSEPTLQTAIQYLAENSETSKYADLLRKNESTPAPKLVPGLIDALKKHSGDLNVVSGVHFTLKFMKDREGLRATFRESGGFNILIDLLSNKNSKIRRTSVRFIGDLITKNKANSDNIANAVGFVEAKGVEAILKTMDDEEQEIQIMSAGVIRVIAGYEGGPSVNLQDAVRTGGGTPVLLKYVCFEGNSTFANDMTRQAATAIRNMCTSNTENQNAFVEAGIIPSLIKKLQASDEVKVKQALYATFYAVCVGNEKSLKTLISEKALEVFAKEVKAEKNEDALEALLVLVAGLANQNSTIQAAFKESGTVSHIAKLCKEEEGPVKEKKTLKAALEALAALANDNQDITKFVVEEALVDRVMGQLAKELTNPIIAAYLHLLRVLAYGLSSVQETIAKSEHFTALVGFIQSDSLIVQEHALEIFRTCRLNSTVKTTLEKSLTVLIDLLMSNSTSVQESAVTCIEHVVNNQEDALNNLRKEKKIVPNLTAVLDRNLKEKLIIRACVLIDKLLTGTAAQVSFPKLQEQFAKCGAVGKLVNILSTGNSEKTKDHATYTLWALVANNEKVQKEAKKAKAIEALVTILGGENADSLKEFAAGSLSAILNNNSSNKKAFGTTKGLDILVKLISTASAEKYKINLTNSLALVVEDNAKAQDQAKEALPHIVKNIGGGASPLLQAASARAVANLCNKNAKLQEALKEHSSLFKEVVGSLQKFVKEFLSAPEDREKSDAVLYLLTLVLHVSTKNKHNTEEFTKEGAIDVVDPLKDSKNKQIAKVAASVLTTLGAGKNRTRTMSSASGSSKSLSELKKDDSKDGKKEATEEKATEEKKSKKEKKTKKEPEPEPEPEKPKKEKKKKEASSDEEDDKKRVAKDSIMVEKKAEPESDSGSSSSSSSEEQPAKKEEPKKEEPKKEEKKAESSSDSGSSGSSDSDD